jgi:hypothetical protein
MAKLIFSNLKIGRFKTFGIRNASRKKLDIGMPGWWAQHCLKPRLIFKRQNVEKRELYFYLHGQMEVFIVMALKNYF